MQFQDAVKKSIKNFVDGNMPKALMALKSEEGLMFTPDYFEELEESLVGQEKPSKKSKKKDAPDEA
jgi:hypothetical protein|tara:strand:- start:229 stop:426 length:198 start_codon:yes stop_codon:yes gene_type:complete